MLLRGFMRAEIQPKTYIKEFTIQSGIRSISDFAPHNRDEMGDIIISLYPHLTPEGLKYEEPSTILRKIADEIERVIKIKRDWENAKKY